MTQRGNATLEDVFRTYDRPRDNYLSRLFGIFGEDVVRHWCADSRARYVDLGRPVLWSEGRNRHTLDFTLRDRETNRTFVAELKSELAFDNYRYLRLRAPDQLRVGKRGAAFDAFLTLGRDTTAYEVRVDKRPVETSGAILVWGAITPEGRTSVIERFGLADVLSLEAMIEQLDAWGSSTWRQRVDDLKAWSDQLFGYLRPA